MITLTRPVASLACAVLSASIALAQNGATAPNANGVSELEAFLAAQPKWSMSTGAKVSFGYKDNLLLSFTDEERSPFVRGSADFLLLRLPQDKFDFSAFAEAETTHYTQGKSVKNENKLWLQAEPGYYLVDTLKVSLPVTGYYYDQVFDVSATEIERVVADLKVGGVMFGPLVRWDFHPKWWVEAQAIAHRKRYDDHANDGDIGEGVMRLGRTWGDWLETRITAARRWRDFKYRLRYSTPGRELPGTHLKIAETEGEFRANITWDDAGLWETSTRVSLLRYTDNGSGFFNFREHKVAHEIEWKPTPWLVRVGGSASRVEFEVETVGIGIEPPLRIRDEFTGEVYVERKLNDHWKVFGSYLWERSRSNDFVDSYVVNEGLLGVRWSWDK